MNKRILISERAALILHQNDPINLVLLGTAPDTSILTQHLVSKSKLTATSGVFLSSTATQTQRDSGNRLPEALIDDKRGDWVTAANREQSGIREDCCCKQVSGRLVGSVRQAPVARITPIWVACGCFTEGNPLVEAY